MSGYSDFAPVYDALMRDVPYPAMAERLLALLRGSGWKPGLVLDFACGTGTLTVELARRGLDVIGADGSAEMLAVAREKCEAAGVSPLLLCQTMRGLDLYGTVTGAVCTLDSLNHLQTLEGLRAAVARVALFLEPGGLFLFDVNTPYKHTDVLAGHTFVYDREDVYCVWRNTMRGRLTVDVALDFFARDGGVWRRSGERFAERAFTEEELSDALARAGLETLSRWDGYTEAPPHEKSERVLYVTRKI